MLIKNNKHDNKFVGNVTEFTCILVALDEMWIYHLTPEIQKQSKQGLETGYTDAKKANIWIPKRKNRLPPEQCPSVSGDLVLGKRNNLTYKLLEQPHSPDLFSFDSYLFPNLYIFFLENAFDEMISALDGYFSDLTEKRWPKWILLIL